MAIQWEWHLHPDPFCDQVHNTACGNPARILEFDCAPVDEGGCSCVHLVDTEIPAQPVAAASAAADAAAGTDTAAVGGYGQPARQAAPAPHAHAHGVRTACAYEENDRRMEAAGKHAKDTRKPKPPKTKPCGPDAHKP